MSFGKLIGKARRRYQTKSRGGKYGRCEQCDERLPLYEYIDERKNVWMLCESCSDVFTDGELE